MDNPYQYLMMKGLRERSHAVQHGKAGKFLALLNTVVAQQPDYLHIDWLHQYYLRRKEWMIWLLLPLFLFEVFFIRYFSNTKLVWTLHNIYPHDWPQHGPYRWARKYFAKNCEWIRVFHHSTVARASVALDVPEKKFKVMPEGSYVGYYKNEITTDAARNKLGIRKEEKILLYLGLIKPYKGVLELIRIFKGLNLDNVRLIIAGKANNKAYWQEIRNELPAPVILAEGFVAKDDLQNYFKASDIVILPFQRIENSGSAILAMGFNKPIIAPRKGVLKERLIQQEGLLYNNIEEMPVMLKTVLTKEKEELENIGELNFAALQKHQWEDFGNLFKNEIV